MKINTESINIPKTYFFRILGKPLLLCHRQSFLASNPTVAYFFTYLSTRDQILLGRQSDHCSE